MSKPYFIWKGDSVEPAGIPVPTPSQKGAEHQQFFTRLTDDLVALATRSRLVCLAGQMLLQENHRHCLTELNPAILQYVVRKLEGRTRLIFAHLDGTLPAGFENKIRAMPAAYLSLPALVPPLAQEMGLEPERQPDGHPKAALNHIYARALAPGDPADQPVIELLYSLERAEAWRPLHIVSANFTLPDTAHGAKWHRVDDNIPPLGPPNDGNTAATRPASRANGAFAEGPALNIG